MSIRLGLSLFHSLSRSVFNYGLSAGPEQFLSPALVPTVASQQFELVSHEVTTRASREVLDAMGGVTNGFASSSDFVRGHTHRFQSSASHIA